MGFDKFKDKITGALSGNQDKVDEGIDKAKDFVDDKTGGKYSDKINSGADKAKDYVDQLDGDDQADSEGRGPGSERPGGEGSGADSEGRGAGGEGGGGDQQR